MLQESDTIRLNRIEEKLDRLTDAISIVEDNTKKFFCYGQLPITVFYTDDTEGGGQHFGQDFISKIKIKQHRSGRAAFRQLLMLASQMLLKRLWKEKDNLLNNNQSKLKKSPIMVSVSEIYLLSIPKQGLLHKIKTNYTQNHLKYLNYRYWLLLRQNYCLLISLFQLKH